MTSKSLKVSVGVRAHNEEANIEYLLSNLLKQRMKGGLKLEEIIVVTSGCTDRTVDIVKDIQQDNDLIKLFIEEERRGPASALNLIFRNVNGDILVIINSDVLPVNGSILNLTKPFLYDNTIGATVGKAVPINDPKTPWGYIAHLFYEWIYLPDFFKLDFEGSVAIRADLIANLSVPDVFCDEHYLDAIIRRKGDKILHVPDAVTYTKQPDNIFDFVNQRRKYLLSHFQMQRLNIYTPHSDLRRVIPLVLKNLNLKYPKEFFWYLAVMFLSAFCYVSAWIDFRREKSYLSYGDTISSKKLISN